MELCFYLKNYFPVGKTLLIKNKTKNERTYVHIIPTNHTSYLYGNYTQHAIHKTGRLAEELMCLQIQILIEETSA